MTDTPISPKPDPVTGVVPPTLEQERRWGRLGSLSAFLSVAILIAALVVANASTSSVDGSPGKPGSKQGKVDELTDFHSSPTGQAVAAILRSGGLLVGIGLALFLFWIVRGRGAPPQKWLLVVAIVGPFLVIGATVFGYLAVKDLSDTFFASGAHTGGAGADRASKLFSDSGALKAATVLDYASRIVFAIGIGTLSLYAMRLELLTKFLGYWGVAAAIAIVIAPIGDAMYIGWLASMGFLAWGWWPGGRPQAWDIPPDTAGPMPAAGI